MAKQSHPSAAIDWGSAAVRDGELTVAFAGDATSDWTERLEAVIERLQRPSRAWGAIDVKRKKLRVADVTPGSEADLRHLLDSAVLQVNADFAPDEPEGDARSGDESSDQDREMSEVFRSFAEPQPEASDSGRQG
jgi:hypothetical protein